MPTGPMLMLFSCAVFMLLKSCSFMADFRRLAK